jgi:copper oxidase (laccase) domain-containing protein
MIQNIKPIYEIKLKRGIFQTFNQRPPFDLHHVHQVHGNIIAELPCSTTTSADGLVTQLNDQTILAIKTADCLPLVVMGSSGHGMLHAGWKSLHLGLLENKILASLSPYEFFIGPAICQKHYEVSADFLDNFPESSHFKKIDDKWTFSLAGYAQSTLQKIFPRAKIDICPLCTFCEPQLHSYRRNKTNDRNWHLYHPEL